MSNEVEYIGKLPEVFNRLPYNDSISKNRKQKHYDSSLLLLAVNKDGHIQTIVDSRFYWTSARSYCCVWVFLPGCNLTGGDYAGGHGYHRDSASLQFALIDAGIDVSGLEGRGPNAMESALTELGEKLNKKFNWGLSNFIVIKTHA